MTEIIKPTYGEGASGPGHCFHQHITFYLRFAETKVPPAAAYHDYVLRWDDLWPAITQRLQLFDAAADHFADYIERTQCFEKFGLALQRVPFQPVRFVSDVESARLQGALLLAAVDTYYLPSFVEYTHVHGLTMGALLAATSDGETIDLWHWENSASVSTDTLIQSIREQGSKVWKLHLEHSARHIHLESFYASLCAAYAVLAAEAEGTFSTY